jgi:hypothetical protein
MSKAKKLSGTFKITPEMVATAILDILAPFNDWSHNTELHFSLESVMFKDYTANSLIDCSTLNVKEYLPKFIKTVNAHLILKYAYNIELLELEYIPDDYLNLAARVLLTKQIS